MSSPHQAARERTIFQTSKPYGPTVDIRGDVAVVYGIDSSTASRVESWRAEGYNVHLMTGVAWGQYHDYLHGGWDGKDHIDEAQTNAEGERISHGDDVYYMCPGPDFGRYLAEGVLRACDAGVAAVHLEEPEFWAKAGYSPAFKREWQAAYNEPWRAPKSSVDARWRANKLMYYLYRRALQQVFDEVQGWNARHGKAVRCYVATHSLLNYATWRIVSPESSLAMLNGSDGFIAQVWTGTSREPNVYQGVRRERTFETAFLEYGIMQNLVRATGRGIWYLADPVEDDPNHTWFDYHDNYQSGLVASLLQPEVAQYEIAPWPERVFGYPGQEGKHQMGGVPIPPDYAQELQQVFNALKDMRQDKMERLDADAPSLAFVMSDSLMFQRGGPGESDPNMSHVYGLAMPFVKRGVPIQPMQLENFTLDGYLDNVTILLMTYEGQKPLTPEVHAPIVRWVKNGGTLIFVDDDSDGFNRVREWWNSGGMSYATPRQHLFERLGVNSQGPTLGQPIGKGTVTYIQQSPSDFANSSTGSERMYECVLKATPGAHWKPAGHLGLRRGHYIAVAGLDETDAPHTTLKGLFVDVFDPRLLVMRHVDIAPGSRHLLVDLDRFRGEVVACAGEATDVSGDGKGWSCSVRGASGTQGIVLVRLPKRAASAKVDGVKVQIQIDPELNMVWVRFENKAREQRVEIRYE